MGKYKMDYQHYFPDVKENPEYGKQFQRVLIKDLSEVPEPKGKYFLAWDTETTGLNAIKDNIVGASFTFDGKVGYYIPIAHYEGCCFGKEGLEALYKIIKGAECSLVYNLRFDFRMMEYAGFSMEKVPYSDVMVNTWLADTNIRMPSLKISAKKFLGMEDADFFRDIRRDS